MSPSEHYPFEYKVKGVQSDEESSDEDSADNETDIDVDLEANTTYDLESIEEDTDELSFVEASSEEKSDTPKTIFNVNDIEINKTNVRRKLYFVCRQLFPDSGEEED